MNKNRPSLNRSSSLKRKLKKGDQVIVISGNWKGTEGQILKCTGDKVLVQGVNLCKKHAKKSEQNPKGAILSIERPIHISNVMLVVDGKPVKLKPALNKEGKKTLVYKKDKTEVVYRTF